MGLQQGVPLGPGKKSIIAGVHGEDLLKQGAGSVKIYDCSQCNDKRKRLQGCPELGDRHGPKTEDGFIWVGGCGTGEQRHPFDDCPGFYLRDPEEWEHCIAYGDRTPFGMAWRAHWAYDRGHSLGEPAPPKLVQAVEMFESELRARRALEMQKLDEAAQQAELKAKYPNAGMVASG